MDVPKKRYTKAEAEVIKKVRDNFASAKMSRQNSCYWDTATGGIVSDAAGTSGGDWMNRWDIQEKMYLMWFEKPSRDEFESNVKSPMTSGRIDSTVNKLRKIDLRFAVRPQDSDSSKDVRKAKIVQELTNELFSKGQFKHQLTSWFKDALIHGVAFLQIYYLKKHRKVQIPLIKASEMSEDQKKGVKEGVRAYKEEKIVEYDDIMIEPIKIQEVFVDPSARCVHGSAYEAQWMIRRMLPSMEQFKAIYEGDPEAKNVSKVRPASAYTDIDTEFFEAPRDVDGDDYVEVLHYYNKPEDKYVVLANDVVIKDMPLPYLHKQIPIVMATTIEMPHQLYGVGIPDRLLPIQTEEEILKNMTYDRLHMTANPIVKVKRNIYGELSKAYSEGSAGLLLPVNQPEDFMPVEFPQMTFDMFRAIEGLERDAVLATQVDPIQMGVMQKYVSATTSMLTKEQMDAFINSLVDSFSEPLSIAGYQIVSLMKQYYSVPRIDEKLGKPKNKKVRLQGIEINPDTMEIIQKKTGDYSFLEVKPEYFDISGDWDVTINPESMEVVSKAIEMQKSQANIAQLAPFLVDPADSSMRMQHPSPWLDGPKMLNWYMETNNIPQDLLIPAQEDEDISMKRAEDQGKRLMAGEEVPGIPGEPDFHKKVHVKQLYEINKKVNKMEDQMGELGPMAGAYVGMLPGMQEMEELKAMARKFALHLQEDDMPEAMAEENVTQKAMGPEVPMPPGMNQASGGGGPSMPMPAGGNQSMGEPQMGGPGGNTGRPPMANAPM